MAAISYSRADMANMVTYPQINVAESALHTLSSEVDVLKRSYKREERIRARVSQKKNNRHNCKWK